MKKITASLLLSALCFLFTGCATMEQGERKDDLWQALTSYRKLLRWGYYEDAARYQLPEGENHDKLDLDYLKGIHITEYEELERVVTSEDTLDVHVKISFYHEDYGNVKTIRDVQNWQYVSESKRWFLDDTLPDLSMGKKLEAREVPRKKTLKIN